MFVRLQWECLNICPGLRPRLASALRALPLISLSKHAWIIGQPSDTFSGMSILARTRGPIGYSEPALMLVTTSQRVLIIMLPSPPGFPLWMVPREQLLPTINSLFLLLAHCDDSQRQGAPFFSRALARDGLCGAAPWPCLQPLHSTVIVYGRMNLPRHVTCCR